MSAYTYETFCTACEDAGHAHDLVPAFAKIDTESWDWTEATEAKCWQGHALDLEEAADKYDEEQAYKAARWAEAEAESYADFMRDGC